jgi:hypothetical protein
MSDLQSVTLPLSTPAGPDAPVVEQAGESLLAGKYKDVAALEKAYKELEGKLGTAGQPAPAAAADLKTPLTAAPVEAPVELDMTPFQAEYEKNGKLSDESYAKLAKENKISKGQVDEFIAFRVQKVQAFQKEVFDSVGGQEQFGQMVEWAKANLSAQEQAAYDKALASNDPGVIKLAVAAVNSKFSEAYGKNPTLLGGRSGGTGPVPYRSQAEMQVAMSDPRYANDPAYRADVEKRVMVSF